MSAGVNISKPLSGDIIANAEPDVILSNCKSVKDSAGMLNSSEPSPANTDAVNLTLTFISFGSIIAIPEPDVILSNSRSVKDSAGMLNRPLPSPLNTDAEIDPLILTEPVNSEPLSSDSTLNPNTGDTDAVTEPLEILGAAAACTFCKLEPSPKYVVAVIEPLTRTEPLNSDVTGVAPSPSTLKNPSGSTDAVIEPVKIRDESIAKLAISMFLSPLPSPV